MAETRQGQAKEIDACRVSISENERNVPCRMETSRNFAQRASGAGGKTPDIFQKVLLFAIAILMIRQKMYFSDVFPQKFLA